MGIILERRRAEAERRIQHALDTGAKELDLSNLRLYELPKSLGRLRLLESLDISGNDLTALPDEMVTMAGLKCLNMGYNRLRSLPRLIARFSGLESLDVSYNGLGSLPDWMANLKSLTSLDVSYNSLGSLPDWMANLTGLTSLEVSYNSLGSLPDWMANLTGLTSLNVSYNRLGSLPDWMANLTGLTSLNVSHNRLGSLPDWMANLTGLTNLDVSYNSLGSLPDWMANLIGLTSLNVSENRLSALPDWMANFTGLQSLDVSYNSLGSLPDWMANLTGLTSLDVNYNRLGSLPDWMANLKGLTSLGVSGNDLGSLPDWMANLTGLTNLDVNYNGLSSLPDWMANLIGLTSLNVSENRLSALPDWMANFTGLQSLDVSSNSLGSLPSSILLLPLLARMYVHGNDLISGLAYETDPDVLYEALYTAKEKRPFNEVKIVVCGGGGFGKTCLIHCLKHGKPPEQRPEETEGITIEEWDLDAPKGKVRAHVWDFAGQMMTHQAHQLFLTKDTLYILMVAQRFSPEANALNYWLRTLDSVAPGAPILIVENEGEGQDLGIDVAGLKQKFPMMADRLYVNAKTGDKVAALVDRIGQEVEKLTHVRDEYPKEWVDLKNRVVDLQPTSPFITEAEYQKQCVAAGIGEGHRQQSLLDMLDRLGVALKYDQDRLAGVYVLDPEWVTKGIYRIIRQAEKANQNGIVSRKQALAMLDDREYPPDRKNFIIDMMITYELALEVNDHILIPSAAKANEGSTGFDRPQFYYEYAEILAGIIPRLIIQNWGDVHQKEFWQKGVIFKFHDCRVRVAEEDRGRLTVTVAGAGSEAHNAYRKTIDAIDKVNQSYENVVPKAMAVDSQEPYGVIDSESLHAMVNNGDPIYIGSKRREASNFSVVLNPFTIENYRLRVQGGGEVDARQSQIWEAECGRLAKRVGLGVWVGEVIVVFFLIRFILKQNWNLAEPYTYVVPLGLASLISLLNIFDLPYTAKAIGKHQADKMRRRLGLPINPPMLP